MNDSEKRSIVKSRHWELIRQTVLFALVIAFLLAAVTYFGGFYNRQNLTIIKQNVQRAAVECYSVEGIYPPDIEYLEEHYSFTYNSDKYYIFYETFASNVMPTVEVYERK